MSRPKQRMKLKAQNLCKMVENIREQAYVVENGAGDMTVEVKIKLTKTCG